MIKITTPTNTFTVFGAHKEECNISLIDWDKETITVDDDLLKKFRDLFNIEKEDSSFVAFYAVTPFPIMNENGPELLSLNDIIENSGSEYFTDYFAHPSSVKDLFGKRYFVLTSGEGGSFFFYDSKTDGVYDSYDVNGIKPDETLPTPKWNSFYDFIESYYGDGVFQ